ncbi:MAG: hypothetical protein ABMA13_21250 [Chthoniobacteraceae bacterium]
MDGQTAFIDCLELEGACWRRWFLVRSRVLLASVEWSWSRDAALAERMPMPTCEAFKAAPETLPMLPTEPPLFPFLVRIFHGSPMVDLPDLPPLTPSPDVLSERRRRHRDVAAGVEAGARVSGGECYERTCKLLGEKAD